MRHDRIIPIQPNLDHPAVYILFDNEKHHKAMLPVDKLFKKPSEAVAVLTPGESQLLSITDKPYDATSSTGKKLVSDETLLGILSIAGCWPQRLIREQKIENGINVST